MSALLVVAFLAVLATALVILPLLAMSGHISELERQAEIEAAIWRARQAQDQDKDPSC